MHIQVVPKKQYEMQLLGPLPLPCGQCRADSRALTSQQLAYWRCASGHKEAKLGWGGGDECGQSGGSPPEGPSLLYPCKPQQSQAVFAAPLTGAYATAAAVALGAGLGLGWGR